MQRNGSYATKPTPHSRSLITTGLVGSRRDGTGRHPCLIRCKRTAQHNTRACYLLIAHKYCTASSSSSSPSFFARNLPITFFFVEIPSHAFILGLLFPQCASHRLASRPVARSGPVRSGRVASLFLVPFSTFCSAHPFVTGTNSAGALPAPPRHVQSLSPFFRRPANPEKITAGPKHHLLLLHPSFIYCRPSLPCLAASLRILYIAALSVYHHTHNLYAAQPMLACLALETC